MIAYAHDEIIPATEVARNFSSVFKSLTDGAKERIAIAKNVFRLFPDSFLDS